MFNVETCIQYRGNLPGACACVMLLCSSQILRALSFAQATAALAADADAPDAEGGSFSPANVTAELETLIWGLGGRLPLATPTPANAPPSATIDAGVRAVAGALQAATAALPGAVRAGIRRYMEAAEQSAPTSQVDADVAALDMCAEAASNVLCFATSVPEVGSCSWHIVLPNVL